MAVSSVSYDEKALLKGLKSWWDSELAENKGPLSPPKTGGTLFDAVPVMDSLSALKGLLTVEEHVSFKVPAKVIRRGGYNTFEDMCGHILPQVKALAAAHASKSASKQAKSPASASVSTGGTTS